MMPDSIEAYKLSQSINLYIRNHGYNYVKYISSSGEYYNENQQHIGTNACHDVSLDVSSQKLNWVDSYDGRRYEKQVEFTTIKGQGLIKNPAVFEHPDFLELRQQKADTEWYQKIHEDIDNSLKEINGFEAKQAEPFRQNQFVEQKYCDVILSAVKKSRKTLENLQVDLNKERDRYTK